MQFRPMAMIGALLAAVGSSVRGRRGAPMIPAASEQSKFHDKPRRAVRGLRESNRSPGGIRDAVLRFFRRGQDEQYRRREVSFRTNINVDRHDKDTAARTVGELQHAAARARRKRNPTVAAALLEKADALHVSHFGKHMDGRAVATA